MKFYIISLFVILVLQTLLIQVEGFRTHSKLRKLALKMKLKFAHKARMMHHLKSKAKQEEPAEDLPIFLPDGNMNGQYNQ